jgi:hypothetical protein
MEKLEKRKCFFCFRDMNPEIRLDLKLLFAQTKVERATNHYNGKVEKSDEILRLSLQDLCENGNPFTSR